MVACVGLRREPNPPLALVFVSLLFFIGCLSNIPKNPPELPLENDPSYTIHGIQEWYLIGNDLDKDDGSALGEALMMMVTRASRNNDKLANEEIVNEFIDSNL